MKTQDYCGFSIYDLRTLDEDLVKLQVENGNIRRGVSPYTTIHYNMLMIRRIEAKTMSKHNPIKKNRYTYKHH